MSAGARRARVALLASLAFCSACGDDDVLPPDTHEPAVMEVLGLGPVPERFTAEVWARGSTAYTTTWGERLFGGVSSPGNAIKIWDVAGDKPVLVDSVIVPDAETIGDVQVSDDGSLLMVPTEHEPGSIVVFSLADPRRPQLLSRFSSANTAPGVHTAELQRVNGKLYAFLSVDPTFELAARLVIVDLSSPAAPVEVFSRVMGAPFVHDVFVRDGVLMTALWDGGVGIFDIGGLGAGGSVANPVLVSTTPTLGGNAHNIWWLHDPVTGSKQYAFVGEEGPGDVGGSSIGDIHVLDVSDMQKPREVAFFSVPGAGTHNFSVDEQNGILYAAYYNGGVRAIDVRGDLSTCDASQRAPGDSRCDLVKMKRELAVGLLDRGVPVSVWGVHFTGGAVYASDMLNGLWKLAPAARR